MTSGGGSDGQVVVALKQVVGVGTLVCRDPAAPWNKPRHCLVEETPLPDTACIGSLTYEYIQSANA